MKSLRLSLIAACLVACAALSGAELSKVPFVTGQQQFKPGDAIVIDQVLASSPQLAVGSKVVVRGHYRLASTTKAWLGLSITHRSESGPDPVSPSQRASVQDSNGTFELSCEVAYDGDLHVSFYPAGQGESFGGVYFSKLPQKT